MTIMSNIFTLDKKNSIDTFLNNPTNGRHKLNYNGKTIGIIYEKNVSLLVFSSDSLILESLELKLNKWIDDTPIAYYLKDIDSDKPYVHAIEWNEDPTRRLEELKTDPTVVQLHVCPSNQKVLRQSHKNVA